MMAVWIQWLRNHSSVTFRIYAVTAIIVAMYFSISFVALTIYVNSIKKEKIDSIQFIATELLEDTAEQAIWRGNLDELNHSAMKIIESTAVSSLTVTTVDGENILFLEDEQDTVSARSFSVDIINNQLRNTDNSFELDQGLIDNETVLTGKIHIVVSHNQLNAIVAPLRTYWLIALVITAALIFPILYILSRSLLMPLKQLKHQIKNFSEPPNDIDHTKNLESNDEFGQIGKLLIETKQKIFTANNDLKLKTEQAIQAEQVAHEANTRKDLFLANISHELTSPLTAILSGLEFMQGNIYKITEETAKTGSDQVIGSLTTNLFTAHDIAYRGSKDIEILVNELLGIVQDMDETTPLLPRNINITEELNNLFLFHQARASYKGLPLRYSLTPSHKLWVSTDWGRVTQILNAIITNAIMHSDEGDITISTHIQTYASSVHFNAEVCNSGAKISQQKIHELENLLSNSRSSKTADTSLEIAARLARKLNGNLCLKSSQAYDNCCFSFTCTFSQANEASTILPAVKASAPQYKIAYVEDVLLNQMIFKQYCNSPNIQLELASNGAEGLELYHRYKPDGMIIDCYMPVLDGFELVSAIREYESKNTLKRTLLIALTADGSDRNINRCLSAGYDHVFTKPYRAEVFNQLISKITHNVHSQAMEITQ